MTIVYAIEHDVDMRMLAVMMADYQQLGVQNSQTLQVLIRDFQHEVICQSFLILGSTGQNIIPSLR
jgi:hypothetical protein